MSLVTDALREGVVSLIRDLNGNHVIQRCLQRLGPEESQFVFDAAAAHTVDIATHRHGCCVLQRCIDFATPAQKRRLVDQIAAHALPLSQVRLAHFPWVFGPMSCPSPASVRAAAQHKTEDTCAPGSASCVLCCQRLGHVQNC